MAKIAPNCQPSPSSAPPIAEPKMLPNRPMPSIQLTPVARATVGYRLGANAFRPVCAPLMQKPAANTSKVSDDDNAPIQPSASTHSAPPRYAALITGAGRTLSINQPTPIAPIVPPTWNMAVMLAALVTVSPESFIKVGSQPVNR